MGSYLSDWQPQRLNGIPGSQHYDDGHANANGHNHFGFLNQDQAREVVGFLRNNGVQVTEWAGDQGAKVGGHKDPGHYDGRSFDVPASQWSPTPDSAKEIAGMRRVEVLVDGFLAGKGVPKAALPYLKPDSGSGTYGTVGSTVVTDSVVEPAKPEPAKPEPMDWKASASESGRSTDPSSQAYWQRQDMRLWAQANPALAKQAMARAGADAAWLEAPAMQTPAAPAAPASAAPAPVAPAPVAPKPEDRGALGGTQVGGPRPKGLQPYSFEIHADQPSVSGGRTGLIGSYLDGDNPLFQKLAAAYGTYGDNYSRQWRGGDLGAPKRGLSIIETRTSGEGMDDPQRQGAEANRLYQTLMADPDVKSGKRPLHFFAGHGDVPAGGEMGSAGEKDWNLGVFNALRQRAQQEGRTNFQFHDPVVAGDDDPQANWNRAKTLRDQWIQQSAGGSK